jgi:hypothetical protein
MHLAAVHFSLKPRLRKMFTWPNARWTLLREPQISRIEAWHI